LQVAEEFANRGRTRGKLTHGNLNERLPRWLAPVFYWAD
jgi:hypothetical protein